LRQQPVFEATLEVVMVCSESPYRQLSLVKSAVIAVDRCRVVGLPLADRTRLRQATCRVSEFRTGCMETRRTNQPIEPVAGDNDPLN